jgi:hypothetical protein
MPFQKRCRYWLLKVAVNRAWHCAELAVPKEVDIVMDRGRAVPNTALVDGALPLSVTRPLAH